MIPQNFIHIVEPFLCSFSIACPYGFPEVATFEEVLFDLLPDTFMHHFLQSGFRRNGNCLYRMNCPDCTACVPIRLESCTLVPDRNQKRVLRKNQDVVVEIAAPEMNGRNLALLNKFLGRRFTKSESKTTDYYGHYFMNRMTNTKEFRYLIGEKLIGVAIVDLGREWINGVYFYFDPDEGKRSPGTFNILYLNEFCREHNIPYLYLGYWIKNCGAMKYKANFKPHQILTNGEWITIHGQISTRQ